ncbi:hypothetical protein [Deinococcus aluminii]|uniref:Uncharacterized protein n=1 Tax=Deinococcus aluminii TaxID=1656885 RepID=A0ABP9XH52_9DEIO
MPHDLVCHLLGFLRGTLQAGCSLQETERLLTREFPHLTPEDVRELLRAAPTFLRVLN